MKLFVFLFLLAIAPLTVRAQQQSPQQPDNEFVQQQFGNTCSIDPKWQPVTGDLNADGIADIVIVARCKNPLLDEGEKNYRVIDPYNSFYGYGNPRVTSQMGPDDPRMKDIVMLVIHGNGAEAWRSTTPKAKFVIINIAIKQIMIKKMRVKKRKTATAIYVEEAGGDQMTSAIFWDGKKYRYEPLGASLE
ncbi:MAG TPA: hypothetical protein VFU76_01195 [Terriglobales bacterium]|nr:hypothetical protein [Terriglobales bacterium]